MLSWARTSISSATCAKLDFLACFYVGTIRNSRRDSLHRQPGHTAAPISLYGPHPRDRPSPFTSSPPHPPAPYSPKSPLPPFRPTLRSPLAGRSARARWQRLEARFSRAGGKVLGVQSTHSCRRGGGTSVDRSQHRRGITARRPSPSNRGSETLHRRQLNGWCGHSDSDAHWDNPAGHR